MISQARQRARLCLWMLLAPAMVACVSQPTQEEQPEAAANDKQVFIPRTGAASESAYAPALEARPRQPLPKPPATERATRVETADAQTTKSASRVIQRESSPPRTTAPKREPKPSSSSATKKALEPTQATQPEPPKPKSAQPRQAPAGPANPSAEPAPKSAPGLTVEDTTDHTPRPRSLEPPTSVASAGPEAAAAIATETVSEPSTSAGTPPTDAEPVPGKDLRLAMIPKPPPEVPRKPDISKLAFDDESLPISFAGGWVLDRRRDAVDGATRCLLFSPKFTMYDGYDPTKVQLQVSLDAVLVKADSNIDSSYPEQGLRVDDGELIAFAPGLLNERSLYTKEAVQVAMASGERLTLALGFWPTWPVTRTQQTTLSLDGFDIAFAALRACSQEH